MRENKKKLFLIFCYLLVIAAMLGTVSWARYKKEISGTVIIPQASDFRASIQLGEESATEPLLIEQLTNLKPGQTAADNMKTGEHGVAFTVNNAVIAAGGTVGKVSDTPIRYTIRVYGKGNIPLSMILYDKTTTDANQTECYYNAVVTKTADGYLYTFEDVLDGVAQKEHAFSLEAETYPTYLENEFVLYLGWRAPDNDDDYDDRKYMKEVESLEIRAIVQAQSTGMEIPEQKPDAKEDPVIVPE